MAHEYISDLVPLRSDVSGYPEQHAVEVNHDFSLVVDDLIQTSEQVAEASIPDGDILDRTQHTEIIGDRLYAYTNITIHGEISASNQRTN